MDFGISVVMIEWTQKECITKAIVGRQMVRDTLDKM